MTTQSAPLFNAIQHPMPIYKHCSLSEIITLGVSLLTASSVMLMLCSWLVWRSVLIGLMLAFPFSFIATRLAISKLATLKQGKPYGFYQQCCRAGLARWRLYHLPYITRKGRWSV